MTDDPFVICSFKDRRSRRDLADMIVKQRPEQFPSRSAVYLKAFNLLVETLKLQTNQRKTQVDKPSERKEGGIT